MAIVLYICPCTVRFGVACRTILGPFQTHEHEKKNSKKSKHASKSSRLLFRLRWRFVCGLGGWSAGGTNV